MCSWWDVGLGVGIGVEDEMLEVVLLDVVFFFW